MLTSKDLLYKALDYDGFWNTSKPMTDSKPSQARMEQLEILLRAFNISKHNAKAESQTPQKVRKGHEIISLYFTTGRSKSMDRLTYIKTLTNFKYFSSGEFIADADRAKYKAVITQITNKALQLFPEHSKQITKEPINLVQLFSSLYHFRLSVYHMFHYSFSLKKQAAFSIEDDFSLHLKKEFMESMSKKIAEVDKLLCMLIDPAKRKFAADQIAYPNYDFKTLDKESTGISR